MGAGTPAPVFKCGWCGAVTEYMRTVPRPRSASAFRCIMRFLSHLKWGVVVFVTLLTLSLIVPGAVGVLPQTCGFSPLLFALNHFITWLLSFNVLFNFFASAVCTPGTVRDCHPMPVQTGQPIPKGAFEHYRYCYQCKYFKPPMAHHCNMCRTCVVDQDHHCPFINNCVGRANQRNFVLFLMWTVAAMLFCVAHTSLLLFWLERSALFDSMARAWSMRRTPFDLVLITMFVILSTPWKLLVPLYIFSASIGVAVSVGMLLSAQLRFIYADAVGLHMYAANAAAGAASQQQGPVPGAGAGAGGGAWPGVKGRLGWRLGLSLFLARWQGIMGGSGLAQWLWPMWGPPPGTCGAVAKKHL